MTISGELMGSPMYMSPEQVTAGRLPLDHRTDIYSLGAALYELITLQTPFEGKQRDQVLSQIIHKEPSSPRSINRRVPKDLETICLKAMEKDPDRRYQTADLMAEDLRRFVNRHAISARRIGPVERAGRWARKNKAVTSMACFTLIVIVSSALFLYSSQRKQHRDEFMEKALTAAMSGKLEEAMTHMKDAKEYGATDSWSHMISGQVHRFRGEVADALEDLEFAIRLDDSNLTAQYMLASAYHENGDVQNYEEKLNELSTREVEKPIDKLFKGQATLIYSYDEAIREMDEAIQKQSGFHLGRLMRAHARAFRGMDQNDEEPVLQAIEEIDAVSVILGEENPFLNFVRLNARLGAYHLFQNKGEPEKAKEYLAKAESDVTLLKGSPRFLYGNLGRMIFYELNGDLKGLEEAMGDALKHNNRGIIVPPYATALYRARKSEQALDGLASMKDDGDPFLIQSRAFLLMEIPGGREEALKICTSSPAKVAKDWAIIDCLFLLGEERVAIEKARELYQTTEPSDFWPLGRELTEYRAGMISEKKEAELVELAGDSERDKAEIYWIIGVRKLSQGNREGARASFNKIASSPMYFWTSIMWARAFAERIEDPNWLDWLPSAPVEENSN
jgi:tetratricopeptide (TPR) repeat protein